MTETTTPTLGAKLAAEFAGTFILVFGSIGTALFAAGFPGAPENPVNVGFLGVALAFGLTVLVSAYAFGAISGGHFNPAVTLGLAAAGRFAWKDAPLYIVTQIVSGIVATSMLFLIATGREEYDLGNFASNGFGEGSPGGFNLVSVLLIETILTAVFLFIIIGVTSKRAPVGFAPLAIGLALTMIHLVSIPVSNTSVNPARSIATAVYGGDLAQGQLWVFILFPIVGALIAGITFKVFFDGTEEERISQN